MHIDGLLADDDVEALASAANAFTLAHAFELATGARTTPTEGD